MTRQQLNEAFALTSFLHGANVAYIEEMHGRYQENPGSVSDQWRSFFAAMQDDPKYASAQAEGPSWRQPAIAAERSGNTELVAALTNDWGSLEKEVSTKIERVSHQGGMNVSAAATLRATQDSIRAYMLIRAYRILGHLAADLDPLGLAERKVHPELKPETYGFTAADMDRPIFLDQVLGLEVATMREIIKILKRTYCSQIGYEYMHITSPQQRAWVQKRIEGQHNEVRFTPEGRRAILNKLIEAESFEKFCDIKYTGTKRFGLDGSESAIPALEQVIKRGGQLGVKEIIFGMAHRGRLNVLASVLAKPLRAIFHEFKGGSYKPDDVDGSGDVKYHLGASSDREFDGNKVHLSLTANPSHLEIVDPVVLGKARAKQDQREDKDRTSVLPVLIHGDAAFAGQGVVAECFGLSGLRGHRTGGSLHFIINNQIGFTTAPRYSRSSPYPSDVAKMIEAPIFHVNGDDPEAVVHCAKIATEFRQRFKKPVVIDMFCYRRHGHNEGDEPSFTQPMMYNAIRKHESVVSLYSKELVAKERITATEVDEMKAAYRQQLDTELQSADGYRPNKADWLDGRWSQMTPDKAEDTARRGNTGVDTDRLREIGRRITTVPNDFTLHKTVQRLLLRRREMIDTGTGIDWSLAEHLAFGSLAMEKFPLRLSGQDVERGTFSQRHAVLIDQVTDKAYTPLRHLSVDQARFEAINSMLSEEAVLGFEYGYSLAEPQALVVWEAQFGDFANGAQVIFDQFLSSGERKWLRMSGLVCLLPHGYEGQGPEHSSARLERFLQMSAEDNWQVANCTTPANYFHILRRQLHRKFRKPLILMTPKSLLRHKLVVSDLDEMGPDTTFHRVLWDSNERRKDAKIMLKPDAQIRRVVLCSGKVYYDLYEERERLGIDDVYLMRVEQLYPYPARTLMTELARFAHADMVWCQEEPRNMGAWSFIEPNLEWTLNQINATHKRPRYVGRLASAATATGLASRHAAEQKALVGEALTVKVVG
jgi:2-oxoglutarate dehydrogenase E1 component